MIIGLVRSFSLLSAYSFGFGLKGTAVYHAVYQSCRPEEFGILLSLSARRHSVGIHSASVACGEKLGFVRETCPGVSEVVETL